jgi:hypothetical protein
MHPADHVTPFRRTAAPLWACAVPGGGVRRRPACVMTGIGQRYVIGMDNDPSKPFVLLGMKGQGTGMQLKYGAQPDDPSPFILIVTSAYVAEKTGKPSSTYSDVVQYVETHADELRAIAIHQRDRGFATEVLA